MLNKKMMSMVLVGIMSVSLFVTGCSDSVKQAAQQGVKDAMEDARPDITKDKDVVVDILNELGTVCTAGDIEGAKKVATDSREKLSPYLDTYHNLENKDDKEQKFTEVLDQLDSVLQLVGEEDFTTATLMINNLNDTLQELADMYK